MIGSISQQNTSCDATAVQTTYRCGEFQEVVPWADENVERVASAQICVRNRRHLDHAAQVQVRDSLINQFFSRYRICFAWWPDTVLVASWAKLETGMFTILPHTADAGLRVEAADLETLFAEAGRGLFSLIVSNLDDVEPRTAKEFVIAGGDVEYLLFDWLSELLYVFESERLLFKEFDVSIGPGGLEASAVGERVDAVRHQMEHEIKAITYHGLVVDRTKHGWAAEVIVDI